MRVLVLVVVGACAGPHHACLKHMHETHWARNWPAAVDGTIRFVYSAATEDTPPVFAPGATDLVLPPQTPTTLAIILRAMGEEALREYDFVLRTVVGTWLHWPDIVKHIRSLPPQAAASGSMLGVDLISEHHAIVSRDVALDISRAPELVTRDPEYSREDVVLSRWLRDRGIALTAVARIDLVFGRDVLLLGVAHRAFAVRLMHFDRWIDVDLFHALTTHFSPDINTADTVKAVLRTRP